MQQKGVWTQDEDNKLAVTVANLGPRNWDSIAASLTNRSAKQCRERWLQHLKPDVSKKPWTPEENLLLLQLHEQYGNSWAKISKHLPGRTDNSVKNHWNSTGKSSLQASAASAQQPPPSAQQPITTTTPSERLLPANNNSATAPATTLVVSETPREQKKEHPQPEEEGEEEKLSLKATTPGMHDKNTKKKKTKQQQSQDDYEKTDGWTIHTAHGAVDAASAMNTDSLGPRSTLPPDPVIVAPVGRRRGSRETSAFVAPAPAPAPAAAPSDVNGVTTGKGEHLDRLDRAEPDADPPINGQDVHRPDRSNKPSSSSHGPAANGSSVPPHDMNMACLQTPNLIGSNTSGLNKTLMIGKISRCRSTLVPEVVDTHDPLCSTLPAENLQSDHSTLPANNRPTISSPTTGPSKDTTVVPSAKRTGRRKPGAFLIQSEPVPSNSKLRGSVSSASETRSPHGRRARKVVQNMSQNNSGATTAPCTTDDSTSAISSIPSPPNNLVTATNALVGRGGPQRPDSENASTHYAIVERLAAIAAGSSTSSHGIAAATEIQGPLASRQQQLVAEMLPLVGDPNQSHHTQTINDLDKLFQVPSPTTDRPETSASNAVNLNIPATTDKESIPNCEAALGHVGSSQASLTTMECSKAHSFNLKSNLRTENFGLRPGSTPCTGLSLAGKSVMTSRRRIGRRTTSKGAQPKDMQADVSPVHSMPSTSELKPGSSKMHAQNRLSLGTAESVLESLQTMVERPPIPPESFAMEVVQSERKLHDCGSLSTDQAAVQASAKDLNQRNHQFQVMQSSLNEQLTWKSQSDPRELTMQDCQSSYPSAPMPGRGQDRNALPCVDGLAFDQTLRLAVDCNPRDLNTSNDLGYSDKRHVLYDAPVHHQMEGSAPPLHFQGQAPISQRTSNVLGMSSSGWNHTGASPNVIGSQIRWNGLPTQVISQNLNHTPVVVMQRYSQAQCRRMTPSFNARQPWCHESPQLISSSSSWSPSDAGIDNTRDGLIMNELSDRSVIPPQALPLNSYSANKTLDSQPVSSFPTDICQIYSSDVPTEEGALQQNAKVKFSIDSQPSAMGRRNPTYQAHGTSGSRPKQQGAMNLANLNSGGVNPKFAENDGWFQSPPFIEPNWSNVVAESRRQGNGSQTDSVSSNPGIYHPPEVLPVGQTVVRPEVGNQLLSNIQPSNYSASRQNINPCMGQQRSSQIGGYGQVSNVNCQDQQMPIGTSRYLVCGSRSISGVVQPALARVDTNAFSNGNINRSSQHLNHPDPDGSNVPVQSLGYDHPRTFHGHRRQDVIHLETSNMQSKADFPPCAMNPQGSALSLNSRSTGQCVADEAEFAAAVDAALDSCLKTPHDKDSAELQAATTVPADLGSACNPPIMKRRRVNRVRQTSQLNPDASVRQSLDLQNSSHSAGQLVPVSNRSIDTPAFISDGKHVNCTLNHIRGDVMGRSASTRSDSCLGNEASNSRLLGRHLDSERVCGRFSPAHLDMISVNSRMRSVVSLVKSAYNPDSLCADFVPDQPVSHGVSTDWAKNDGLMEDQSSMQCGTLDQSLAIHQSTKLTEATYAVTGQNFEGSAVGTWDLVRSFGMAHPMSAGMVSSRSLKPGLAHQGQNDFDADGGSMKSSLGLTVDHELTITSDQLRSDMNIITENNELGFEEVDDILNQCVRI